LSLYVKRWKINSCGLGFKPYLVLGCFVFVSVRRRWIRRRRRTIQGEEKEKEQQKKVKEGEKCRKNCDRTEMVSDVLAGLLFDVLGLYLIPESDCPIKTTVF
jgi:hypothetical protein